MFSQIKNIKIDTPDSWENQVFITFDIDWCSDEVLSYTLDMIEKNGLNVTFFVTHNTILLERMRKNPNIELGIHPNFNLLLNGDFRYGKNMSEVVEYYKKIVPEAVSVRSHSLTSQSPLSNIFSKKGFFYECNQIIPENSNIIVKPYQHWEKNLSIIPHFWEDDVHCIYNDYWDVNKYLNYKGIKVFNFHPIHIFLNSENLSRYDRAKEYSHDFIKLQKFQNRDSFGTNDMLKEIIEKINKLKKENKNE